MAWVGRTCPMAMYTKVNIGEANAMEKDCTCSRTVPAIWASIDAA